LIMSTTRYLAPIGITNLPQKGQTALEARAQAIKDGILDPAQMPELAQQPPEIGVSETDK